MKISYNWLKEYINLDISPEELSFVLTNCGLEVEELALWESVRGGLKGVVIGHVIKCDKHPDADKLSVTMVDSGPGDPLQIVCGAPNVALNQKVLIAPPGTTLYKNEESWDIKKTKIRGIESCGMICAEDELGLGSSHEGIMVLPEDAPTGMAASDYFNIEQDWVFTIGLTPNRVDAASHIGVARDVAAALNAGKQHKYAVRIPDLSAFSVNDESNPIDIIVDDPEACPRYSGITISNLNIAPSPKWLADRLSAAGMRPINNVVDITNYVMLETGHPLHAFDIKHIKGKQIVVKKFAKPFDFITLDQAKRTIHTEDLMICNSEEGMCIAGVFGGIDSGVNDNTSAIFLESAYFNPVSVRKTGNRHSLKTESSFRFERGADPSMTITALKRAALLFREIAGGTISSPLYDVFPKPIKKAKITLTHDFVNQSVGVEVPDNIQLEILKDLDFEIIESKNRSMTVLAPFAKVDVTRPADVVEEILRIFGYNNVPMPTHHKTNLTISKKTDSSSYQNVFAEMLTGAGFFEILTNSLSSASYYTESNGYDPSANVRVINALSNELNTMRRTLMFSGLESIVHNINRKQTDIRFFEFGKTYNRILSHNTKSVTETFHEEMKLGLWISGKVFPLNWKYQDELYTFFHLKDVIGLILKRAGIVEDMLTFVPTGNKLFQNGLGYSLKTTGKTLLETGEVSTHILEQTECRQPVFFAEICWNTLLEFLEAKKVKATEPPKFPEVHRDIALLLDSAVQYSKIRDIVRNQGGRLVKSVSLFDIYDGKNLPEGKKSYAIHIILQDADKTLTDQETEAVVDNIRKALIKNLGAHIR
jgi:phenylalanyl-tRNA synthetase beta chain